MHAENGTCLRSVPDGLLTRLWDLPEIMQELKFCSGALQADRATSGNQAGPYRG